MAEQIADERFALAVPKSHRLSRGNLELRKLDGEPFIALPEKDSPEARRTLIGACASVGFLPDVRFEAAEPSVVLGLVEAGIGLAIVQESLSRARIKGVVFRPLPPSFPMRAQIYRVTKRNPRPIVERFLCSQRAS